MALVFDEYRIAKIFTPEMIEQEPLQRKVEELSPSGERWPPPTDMVAYEHIAAEQTAALVQNLAALREDYLQRMFHYGQYIACGHAMLEEAKLDKRRRRNRRAAQSRKHEGPPSPDLQFE